jgi:hypothetical protein
MCAIVDAFLEASITQENQRRCSLHRADGPRAGAGRSAAWCEAAVLSDQGRTVRGLGRTVRGLVQEPGFPA